MSKRVKGLFPLFLAGGSVGGGRPEWFTPTLTESFFKVRPKYRDLKSYFVQGAEAWLLILTLEMGVKNGIENNG